MFEWESVDIIYVLMWPKRQLIPCSGWGWGGRPTTGFWLSRLVWGLLLWFQWLTSQHPLPCRSWTSVHLQLPASLRDSDKFDLQTLKNMHKFKQLCLKVAFTFQEGVVQSMESSGPPADPEDPINDQTPSDKVNPEGSRWQKEVDMLKLLFLWVSWHLLLAFT